MVGHKVLGMENPWIGLAPDVTPELTAPGRYEMLDMAVKEGWKLMHAHVEFPGLMFVDNQGVNYQATAASYIGSANAKSVCM